MREKAKPKKCNVNPVSIAGTPQRGGQRDAIASGSAGFCFIITAIQLKILNVDATQEQVLMGCLTLTLATQARTFSRQWNTLYVVGKRGDEFLADTKRFLKIPSYSQ